MPQHKIITTYKFEELSDKAKEKAREWWREAGYDFGDGWWDDVYDDAKKILGYLGFENIDPSFSGFYSQGDGASFTATWNASYVEFGKAVEYAPDSSEIKDVASVIEDLAHRNPEAACKLYRNDHRYSHARTVSYDLAEDFSEVDDEAFIGACRDVMYWLYGQLEKTHDWMLSNEYIDDALTANEYEFTIDGSRSVIL